ncbi:hypothetical protein J2I47_07470 [Fibrella sp. HMF5335]|uniref:Uncharacterized protein n=1 Tax=Fibrella rubiginis TaxID=2817060 RepID=A0A939K2J5_9BACT|nr:hypothetical protein [Fibrella rubiginis]MBO0936384.1 hypothetical protein [Fibrella rubiginis]
MNTIKNALAVIGLAAYFSACAPSMNFKPSSITPAATGKVQIKRDKNDNHVVHVNVRNLAPADRLSTPQQAYIVWADMGRNDIRKLGQITPRNKLLEASLTATTVSNPDRIFITAESTPQVQYPSSMEVLTTR